MDFALGQFDIMCLIGQEVECVRETEKNKKKFGQVVAAIDSINRFVELSYDGVYAQTFLEKLWDCHGEGLCYPGDEVEEDWDEDDFVGLTIDRWWDECPFLKIYCGCGDYNTVLWSVADQERDARNGFGTRRGYRQSTVKTRPQF
tara:strand:+ start:747 stop:1181 length:435 start_codon:yes stop_codon:yes gene_type:complete